MPDVRAGPLVLADIGGYTAYLRGVELDHATDVLGDLLGAVAATLGAAVPVVKLEGDAVFCAGGEPAADDTALLTAIVDTYVAFQRRRRAISVATSCPCDACRRIPELGLKLPYDYFSYRERNPTGRMLWTVELEPVGERATRLRWLIARSGGAGQRVVLALMGGRLRGVLQESFDSLVRRLGGAARIG